MSRNQHWYKTSATRIELKGAYTQPYLLPTYMDNMRNHIEQVAETLGKYLLKYLPLYGGHEEYSEAVLALAQIVEYTFQRGQRLCILQQLRKGKELRVIIPK